MMTLINAERVTYLSLWEENPRFAFEAMFRLAGRGGYDLGPSSRRAVFAGGPCIRRDGRTTTCDALVSLSCLRCSVFDCIVTASVTIWRQNSTTFHFKYSCN